MSDERTKVPVWRERWDILLLSALVLGVTAGTRDLLPLATLPETRLEIMTRSNLSERVIYDQCNAVPPLPPHIIVVPRTRFWITQICIILCLRLSLHSFVSPYLALSEQCYVCLIWENKNIWSDYFSIFLYVILVSIN